VEIVRLREKSDTIQLTAKEALEEALASSFSASEVIIILHDGEEGAYEYWQGGGLSYERMFWHAEQFQRAVLEGRIRELD